MNKKMMDVLACPIDKHNPLELFECKTSEDKVIEGVLFCIECARFFPIIEEIPVMLPDELRDKKEDIEFLKKNKSKLPEKIITRTLPWHL